RLVEVRATLDGLRARARERVVELEGLQAGLEHIERVAPLPGEDEDLRLEDERLGHSEELRGSAARARAALAGDEDAMDTTSVLSHLALARSELETVARLDPS